MLLIVEIALVILAVRRGWKGYAAIPVALALACGVGVGIWAAMEGMERNLVMLMSIGIDGLAIMALATMCAFRGPFAKSDQTLKTDSMAKQPQKYSDYQMVRPSR